MMKRDYVLILAFIGALVLIEGSALGILSAPFDTPPYTTDTTGNSAGRDSGGYLPRVSQG